MYFLRIASGFIKGGYGRLHDSLPSLLHALAFSLAMIGAVESARGSNAKVAVLQQAQGGRGVFGTPIFYSHNGVNDPAMAFVAQLGPDDLPDLVLANAYDGIYVYYQDSSAGGAFSTATNIGN